MKHTIDTKRQRALLQVWYLHGLEPKLAAAVNAGQANAAEAAALDLHVRQLLDLHSEDTPAEAA